MAGFGVSSQKLNMIVGEHKAEPITVDTPKTEKPVKESVKEPVRDYAKEVEVSYSEPHSSILSKYKRGKKKERYVDSHISKTYYFDKETYDLLERVSKETGADKSAIICDAIKYTFGEEFKK